MSSRKVKSWNINTFLMLVKSICQRVNIAWSSSLHCQTSSYCPPPGQNYYLGEGGGREEGGGGIMVTTVVTRGERGGSPDYFTPFRS